MLISKSYFSFSSRTFSPTEFSSFSSLFLRFSVLRRFLAENRDIVSETSRL